MLNNLASSYYTRREFTPALSKFEEALKIRRQLAEQNPDTYLLYVGLTAVNISAFYLKAIPDKEKSLSFAYEALNATEPFETDLPLSKVIVSTAKQVITAWSKNLS